MNVLVQPLIKKLPVSLANKIAAGEVVERPASVVKELIENAIDADARKIIIILKQSGKQLINIIDDGCGMTEQDLKMAFERHATSKIATVEDLEQIETLGFRGEALPSIASVAQVEAVSRTPEDQLATILRLEGGGTGKVKKKAAPSGTNVSIKNLFFNTPARRNFLKSDQAELQQILTVLKRFFLAYPEIEFEVLSDDSSLFKLKSGTIEERLKEVFGEAVFTGLMPLKESLGGIELAGYVSRPDMVRRTRGNQFLFLNGRPIQDKSLNHAIYQGYGNLIESGTYPTFCLFLEMNPKLVDINVHPTKMEVRFSNDRSLYFFFMSSLRKVFKDANVIPKLAGDNSEAFLARFQEGGPEAAKNDIAREIKNRSKLIAPGQGGQLSLAYFSAGHKDERSQPEIPEIDVDVQFWQIHNRYILSEIKSGLVVIDQHIAHERILFERILKTLRRDESAGVQHLLFPQTVTLSVDDYLIFDSIKELLEKIGFGIKVFSGNSLVIDTLPIDVKTGREGQVLLDIIDYYKEEGQAQKFDAGEKMAAAFACKNAIKSGDALTTTQMHSIVDQLFACEEPYFCPHGRPVLVTIDLEELDRKFKRIK